MTISGICSLKRLTKVYYISNRKIPSTKLLKIIDVHRTSANAVSTSTEPVHKKKGHRKSEIFKTPFDHLRIHSSAFASMLQMLLHTYSELSYRDSITYFKTSTCQGARPHLLNKNRAQIPYSPGIITKEGKGRILIPEHEILNLKAYTVPPGKRPLSTSSFSHTYCPSSPHWSTTVGLASSHATTASHTTPHSAHEVSRNKDKTRLVNS